MLKYRRGSMEAIYWRERERDSETPECVCACTVRTTGHKFQHSRPLLVRPDTAAINPPVRSLLFLSVFFFLLKGFLILGFSFRGRRRRRRREKGLGAAGITQERHGREEEEESNTALDSLYKTLLSGEKEFWWKCQSLVWCLAILLNIIHNSTAQRRDGVRIISLSPLFQSINASKQHRIAYCM